MTFYRPYSGKGQTLGFWDMIQRDVLAFLWLLREGKFLTWWRGANRWFVFTRLEVYLPGWDEYSWGTPKWGYWWYSLITFPEESKVRLPR